MKHCDSFLVTLCPETKARTEAFNYTSMYHILTQMTYGNLSYDLSGEE